MSRKACLAIGVGTVKQSEDDPVRFAYLDGAILAAQAIGQWALRSGFGETNVRVVDDGSMHGKAISVTRERVQQAVDELFPEGAETVEHFVLAFCGHGLTDENFGSISWLFTDSLSKKYRIVADRFHAELQLHGMQRVTMIIDACRETPKTFELMRLDAVRGIVVDGKAVDSPKLDRLAACQDGQLGFMIVDRSSAAPGKCVFSGVIADVLWGVETGAIVNGVVTTSTLGTSVRERTAERAKDYRLKLDPQCNVDPQPIVVYDTKKPPTGPADLQPWPPTSATSVTGGAAQTTAEASAMLLQRLQVDTDFRDKLLGAGFGSRAIKFNFADSVIEPFSIPAGSLDLLHELVTLKKSPGRSNAKKARAEVLVRNLETDVGIAAKVATANDVRKRLIRIGKDVSAANLIAWGNRADVYSRTPTQRLSAINHHVRFHVSSDRQGTPVLLRLADDQLTPVVPYDRLDSVVVTSDSGEVYQAYGSRDSRHEYQAAVAAIGDFAAGCLGPESIELLASRMRSGKHADPVLGAICAYLYRALADFDSIRRMAYFYVKHRQPVPFDIALLGAMTVTRGANGNLELLVPAVKARQDKSRLPFYVTVATPKTRATIGGLCPWLGLGWDHVGNPRPEWALLVEGLEEFAKEIPRNGATVFSKQAGAKLVKRWNLSKQTSKAS